MVHIKDAIDNVLLSMMEKVYKGKAPISQKIAIMILTRREYHGNERIQSKCNEYLDDLYNKKYEMLEAKSGFRIHKNNAQ